MKRLLIPLLIVLFGAIGGTAGFLLSSHYYDNPPPPPGVTQVGIGELVPDFTLTDSAGRDRHLSEWRGKLVVVNYWASWCPPCVEEMPMLDSWANDHADAGVAVIGIAEDDPDAALGFLRNHPVGYPILIGRQQLAGSSMQMGNSRNVLPFTVVIGADGRLLERKAGLLDRSQLDTWRTRHGG